MSIGRMRVKPEPKATDAYHRRCLIEGAIRDLQLAREALRRADAPRTLARVRAALKSADGARRHAQLRPMREADKRP